MSLTKPLTTEEKVVTLLACLVGVGIFFLSPLNPSSPLFSFSRSKEEAVEFTHKEERFFVKERSAGRVSERRNPLPAAAPAALVVDELEVGEEILELEDSLKLKGFTISRLKGEIAELKLAAQNQEATQTEESAVIPAPSRGFSELKSQLIATHKEHEAEKENLNKEITILQARINETPIDPALQAKLGEQEAAISKLETSLRALHAENDKLKKEAKKDIAVLVKPAEPAVPTFASSADNLADSEGSLFKILQEIDSLSGAALEKKYAEIKEQVNAQSQSRIGFESGKSDVSSAEAPKLAKVAASATDGSRFLIVGYADQSGSAKANRKLSSARAQAVASYLSSKVPGDRIQSIYLGQTARFGEKANNRVVEVWEILPR